MTLSATARPSRVSRPLIDLAHAPGAKEALDLVRPKSIARKERHGGDHDGIGGEIRGRLIDVTTTQRSATVSKMLWTMLVAAITLLGPQVFAQQPPGGLPVIEFNIEVLGTTLGEFTTKMDAYADLRRLLQQGLPPLAVTDNPDEIRRAERLLAQRIRRARSGDGRGDMFTEGIRHGFRQLLRPVTNAATCELIRDDNPGEFAYAINGDTRGTGHCRRCRRPAGSAAAPARGRVVSLPRSRSHPA